MIRCRIWHRVYMVYIYLYTTPDVCQKVVKKVKKKQETVTVSDTRKIDLSMMFFRTSPFCGPIFERFTKKHQTKKQNNVT